PARARRRPAAAARLRDRPPARPQRRPAAQPGQDRHRRVTVPKVTVFEKRTCTTCRQLHDLLSERGVEAERVEYHVEGIGEGRLRELLAKGGLRPADVLRRREPLVAELGLDGELPSDDELVRLMV